MDKVGSGYGLVEGPACDQKRRALSYSGVLNDDVSSVTRDDHLIRAWLWRQGAARAGRCGCQWSQCFMEVVFDRHWWRKRDAA